MTPADPLDFLLSMDTAALLVTFSFSLILDIPRYTFGFLAVLMVELGGRRGGNTRLRLPSISVIIAGHNEAASIRRCVLSLREQTVRAMEIICVDDGSTDGMSDELYRLRAEGLIDTALVCRIRCGKSSAANFAMSRAYGEVIVNVDVDCTFDRDAIANIVGPLADPTVGAVCGNIGVRNAAASVLTRVQVVEYLIGISLGKRALDFLNVVACASGAFSAFRRTALEGVGGMDVGPGEDLDLTLRLRQAAWRIRFAHDAWCLTEVPASLASFVRQRLRWERDALRIRLRKHRRSLDPRDRGITVTDLVHQFDYIVTNLLVTLVFPVYLGWLALTYSGAAWIILGSVTLGYVVLDLIAFLVALVVVDRPGMVRAFALRARLRRLQRLLHPRHPACGVCPGMDFPPVDPRQLRSRPGSRTGASVLIRRLRRPVAVDTLRNDVRPARARYGRWVYLALIAAFVLWVGDLLVGSLVRLRADGLVVAEHIPVTVPFAAQVIETRAEAGGEVEAGSVLARVSSVALAQDIALLTARHADLLLRRLELERAHRVAEAVLPVAQHCAGEAEAAMRKIERYRGDGDVGLTLWMQTLRDRFETKERVAELQASLINASRALSAVGGAIVDAATALDDLRAAYDEGEIHAPVDGTVGLRTARPGEVVGAGEPLMVLYRPERFVLAYLETGGLYTVRPGDAVELSSGFVQTTGTVSEVFPVADQLPPEFQKSFQPRQRGQVIRVAIADPGRLPLFAKVAVSGRGWFSGLISTALAAAVTHR